MTAWLEAILTPLNAASQSLQKLIEVRDTIKLGEEMGKLQNQILSAITAAVAAKADQAALLDQIGDLKKKVAELEGWNTEKERYELVDLAPNVLAYRPKPHMQNGEPPHYICATCYNSGKKNFLRQTVYGSDYNCFECHGCSDKLSAQINPGRQRYASRGPRDSTSWMGN